MNLDVILRAASQNMEAFVTMTAALAAVKAEANSTGESLDNVKMHSEATTAALNLLGDGAVDVKARFAEAKTRAEELKGTLQGMGLSAKEAEAATTRLGESLARKMITRDLAAGLRDAGVAASIAGQAARTTADQLIKAKQSAESTVPIFSGLGTALGRLPPLWIAIAIAIVPLTAALGPLVAELGAVLVLIGAWVVGAAAFAGVLAVAVGALGAVAAAVLYLGIQQTGTAKAADNLTAAQNANTAAQLSLQRAQNSAGQTHVATANQLLAVQTAQQRVTTTAQAHAAAVSNLQQTQAGANQTHALTAAQLQTLTARQQAAATATGTAHANAVVALQRAQNSAAGTHAVTANQLLTLTAAQQKAADTQAALTQAEIMANGPLPTLIAHLQDMAKVLGEQAAPMTVTMIGFIDQLVPRVQDLGTQLFTWFGDRLPAVMQAADDATNNLFDGLTRLGGGIGRLVDHVLAGADVFGPVLKGAFDGLVTLTIGLLDNLVRLSDWFIARLPTLGPIVAGIFGAIGGWIQDVGYWLGKLVDWVITNWPTINSVFKQSQDFWSQFVRAIGDGVDFVGPIWTSFLATLILLGPVFKFIHDNADELKPVLLALGVVVGILAALIVGAGLIIVGAIALVILIFQQFDVMINQFKKEWPGIARIWGQGFSDFGDEVHRVVLGVGHFFSDLGTSARDMQGLLLAIFRGIGDAFSALGNGVQSVVGAIGRAFSGLGGSVHGSLHAVAHAIDDFDRLVNGIPVLGGILSLPTNLEGFAGGGVIPGYAPGRDSVLARLSPGEGILTPQTVRGLGGSAAIDALNASHGMGAGSFNPGDWMGQCVVAVETWLNTYWPVAMASQLAAYVNSSQPAPGSVFVSTLPPFGHTGIVIGGGKVIDSNWGLDQRVQIHALSDIPSIVGYISGVSSGLGHTLFDVTSAMKGLVGRALGGLGGWEGDVARGLIGKIIEGATRKFDSGGILPPGLSLARNDTGRGESVLGSKAEAMLESIDRRLARGSGAGEGLVVHSHLHLDGQEIAQFVERISDARLSRLMTAT